MDKLKEICENKRKEVAQEKASLSDTQLSKQLAQIAKPRGFERTLRRAYSPQYANQGPRFGLIAEIKKASPSKGLIRKDFDPAAHAKSYEQGERIAFLY